MYTIYYHILIVLLPRLSFQVGLNILRNPEGLIHPGRQNKVSQRNWARKETSAALVQFHRRRRGECWSFSLYTPSPNQTEQVKIHPLQMLMPI